MYAGDVYILQDGVVVGMVGQMLFRRVPRLLMDKFFSPPDTQKSSTGESAPKPVAPIPAPAVPASRETLAPTSAAVLKKPNTEAPSVPTSGPGEKLLDQPLKQPSQQLLRPPRRPSTRRIR